MPDRCVMCGQIIPEDRQVCWECQNKCNECPWKEQENCKVCRSEEGDKKDADNIHS